MEKTTPHIEKIMEEFKTFFDWAEQIREKEIEHWVVMYGITPKKFLERIESKLQEAHEAGRIEGFKEAIEIVDSITIISPNGNGDVILEQMQALFDREWKGKIKSFLTNYYEKR